MLLFISRNDVLLDFSKFGDELVLEKFDVMIGDCGDLLLVFEFVDNFLVPKEFFLI